MERQLLRWFPPFVLLATVLYTVSVYPDLPARMPAHFGLSGQPNGWSPREVGAWLLPGVMVILWGLSVVLPRLDPRGPNSEKFGAGYHVAITAILASQGVIQWAMLNIALGHPVAINTVILVAFGVLFVLLGVAIPLSRRTR
jgi:uncharacterized membrane protein